ncbi:endonuclease MutS2 [Capsicum chacoense]
MLLSLSLLLNSSPSFSTIAFASPKFHSVFGQSIRFKVHAFLNKPLDSRAAPSDQPSVLLDSLRVLEWDKLCDCVANFAGTSLGKEALKEQLGYLNQTFEDSLGLLEETNAAVEMNKYGAMVDFNGIDIELVKIAIRSARRGLPVSGTEAMNILALLQVAEMLHSNVKAAIKQDTEWYQRFMPITEMILELTISRSLVRLIQQLVDEDGSVKDSASFALKQSRDQVRLLERKLYQFMESIIRNGTEETSSMEVSEIDGRWCIRAGFDQQTSFGGLLLSSASGTGSFVEPISAVPLNDALQQAKASVSKAEADVLLMITKKMKKEIDYIESIFSVMVKLDVINARARYSLAFGGAFPNLFLQQELDSFVATDASLNARTSGALHPTRKKWTMYLPKAYHPLLLQKHQQALQKAMKDVKNANVEIRRRKRPGENITLEKETNVNLQSLEAKVARMKEEPPVPVDICVAHNTRVLVITGPNTGGKTICLKTVGLAALMAKSGLYVLASESVKIPWFDFVFADIGDEQSLSQSLSTFSGHLKQISKIRSHSTNMSLVLLDEVGAGTNPLEGAALGMSLLESFAESGSLLTIATTHHGELKTLKYSNHAFENACMEFDEMKLKPTYRILLGIPGLSNAINIAERLGIPDVIVYKARELYGAASAEINEVILDMERFKQNFHEQVRESQRLLKLTKDLHHKLLIARKNLKEHNISLRWRKVQEISNAAAVARSSIQRSARQYRAICSQPSQKILETNGHSSTVKCEAKEESEISEATPAVSSASTLRLPVSAERRKLPNVGDSVRVPSLNKQALVLKVDPSREELLVQAGNMKLKLKLTDVLT